MMVLRFKRNNLGSKRKQKKPGSLLSFQGNLIEKKKKIPRLAWYNLRELIHSLPKHTLNPKSVPAEADLEGNEAPRSSPSSTHPDVAMKDERQGRT